MISQNSWAEFHDWWQQMSHTFAKQHLSHSNSRVGFRMYCWHRRKRYQLWVTNFDKAVLISIEGRDVKKWWLALSWDRSANSFHWVFLVLRNVWSNSSCTSWKLRLTISLVLQESQFHVKQEFLCFGRRLEGQYRETKGLGSRIQGPGSGVVVSEFDVATYRVGYCFCISSCYETKSIKRWSLSTTQLELLWSRNFYRENVIHIFWNLIGSLIFYRQSFQL